MNPDNQQTIKELGQRVKAKYPQYKDMDDVEVGRRTKAKHPEAYGGFRDLNIDEQKQELRNKGQAVSVRSDRAEPTAVGGFVRDTTKVGARIGQNIGNIGRGLGVLGKQIAGKDVTAEEMAFNKKAGRTDFFGEVQPIGQQENFGEALKDSVGAGLEVGSFIPVGTAASVVGQGAKAVAKGAVKKGITKQLAKEGLTQGALYGGGKGLQENETLGTALGSAFKGAVAGGATGGALGLAATRVVNPLIGKVATEFNVGAKLNKAQTDLTSKINKAIGLRGKKTVGALSREAQGINNKRVEGFEILFDNAQEVNVTDADGLSKVFEPKNATFSETIQALEQTKFKFHKESDKILQENGKGFIEMNDVVNSLVENYLNNPTYGKASKNFVADIAEDIAKLDNSIMIDGYLKNEINPLLGKLISGSDAKNARIAANIHKLLTKKVDDALALSQSDIRGPYGQYSALKSIEKDLVARAQQQMRKVGGGLSDYADIFSIPEVFSGLITSNPALIAQGVGRVGITRLFKAMKDPERLLRGVFKDIEKLKGIKPLIPTKKVKPIKLLPEAGASSYKPDVIEIPPRGNVPFGLGDEPSFQPAINRMKTQADEILSREQTVREMMGEITDDVPVNVKKQLKQDIAEELNQLEVEIELLQEAVDNNPMKKLIKFTNKRTGELPEITGKGRGQFRTKGDDIANEVTGEFDSEVVRGEMLDQYKNMRDTLKEKKITLKNLKNQNKQSFKKGAVPKTANLVEKAKKFDSAEEFISQQTPIAQFTEDGKTGKFWTTPEGANRFHGTSQEIKEVGDGFDFYNNENIYGQGFYTSDAVDVAESYTKKGKGGSKNLYSVTEKPGVKIYDAESKIDDELLDKVNDMLGTDYSNSYSIIDIYDDLRDASASGEYTRDTVQDFIGSINDIISSRGFDGISHTGGKLTGGKAHNVKIYFNPKKSVTITKLSEATQANKSNANLPKSVKKGAVPQTANLVEQAKKFDSAEEFVDVFTKQDGYGDDILVHGTNNELIDNKLKIGAGIGAKKGGQSGGLFMTNREGFAKVFGNKLYYADKSLKHDVLDLSSTFEWNKVLNQIGKKYRNFDGEDVVFTKEDYNQIFPEGRNPDFATISMYADFFEDFLPKINKKGLAFPELAGGVTGKTFQFLDDEIPVYTKSQLKDIWKQANN